MATPITTSLNLLTRDGAVCIKFFMVLTPPQYDELYKLVDEAGAIKQVQELVLQLSHKWQCHATAEPC